mmetsp:Transcript_102499/g.289868  ORF Transcript_102499/g.289868 Transcript_102499/m.289868 type:complete len:407 (+) Transcript_102499:74-1294(+)
MAARPAARALAPGRGELPCVPWKLFRGNAAGASGTSSAVGGRQWQPREICRALSDSIDALAPADAAGRERAEQLTGTSDHPAEARASVLEEVQNCLQAVLRRLDAANQDATSMQEAQEVVSHLLAADMPARLVTCLDVLEFETRKDAMRLFFAVLKLGTQVGADGQVIEYVRTHSRISQLLLEGSGRPQVFTYFAQMLRYCMRYPQLVAYFHGEGATTRLIELARHESFDVSSEAFSSLRELLLAHKTVSAAYLQANFQEFFEHFNTLLQVQDYVTQRQALRLLGEVLLDRSFMQVMVAYVGNEQFLQIHMNLLRDESKAIQLEAFHVFKIFVANPSKPQRVQHILHRNKERLVKLLEALGAKRESDKPLVQDLKTVIGIVQALEPPGRTPVENTTVEANPVVMVA